MQLSPAGQLIHVAPFVPQALLLVPSWHWPLESQQPLGQEVALQTFVHTWFWQACPAPQLVHAAPSVPQALLLVPSWHWPRESQQPLGQEVALQTFGVVHTWFWQVCPWLQSVHAAPPFPQAPRIVPGWHVPRESQQPLGQELALQTLGVVHTWF